MLWRAAPASNSRSRQQTTGIGTPPTWSQLSVYFGCGYAGTASYLVHRRAIAGSMIVRTVWTNLAIQAMTFATSVLTARILGPVGRGELALVLLYPQLVAGIALMGVDRAVAVLSGRGRFARPVTAIIKLAMLLSIPAMGAGDAVLTWRVADPHLSGLATIYLAYVPAVYFFTLAVYLFNVTGDFVRFNVVRLGFYVLNLIVLISIWLVAPFAALDWVVVANLVSVYGGLALAGWLLRGFGQSVGAQIATTKND